MRADRRRTPYDSTQPSGRANHFMAFCLPRAIPFRWELGARCRATVRVYSLDGEILDIDSGYNK